MYFAVLPPLAAILLLGFVLARFLRLPAAFAPFVAVCTVSMLMLALGCLNLLWAGRWLLYLGIAAAGALAVWRAPKAFLQYLAAPGVWAFLLGAAALCLYFVWNDSFYSVWDEYSHWGPFFKNAFLADALHPYTPMKLNMVNQAYPQAATAFYYFFALAAPRFSEAHTYAALAVLLCAAAATLLAGCSWKRPVTAALGILCVPLFFVLFPYSDPYITVYQDTLLGAVFGGVLVLVLYSRRALPC